MDWNCKFQTIQNLITGKNFWAAPGFRHLPEPSEAVMVNNGESLGRGRG